MEEQLNILEIDGGIVVTGEVNLAAAESIIRRGHMAVVDISQAHFIIDEEEWKQFLGYSHHGPVYGASGWREVDVLKRFLENVWADKVILPADVARRHINAATRNAGLFQLIVPDDCRLFAMKDGDVYNKKLTKVVFQAKTPDEIYHYHLRRITAYTREDLNDIYDFAQYGPEIVSTDAVTRDFTYLFECYKEALDLITDTFGELFSDDLSQYQQMQPVYALANENSPLPPDKLEQVKAFAPYLDDFFDRAANLHL